MEKMAMWNFSTEQKLSMLKDIEDWASSDVTDTCEKVPYGPGGTSWRYGGR